MDNPLLSVIVAHYNSSDILINSINSVISSFNSVLEFIIVDDCSDEYSKNKLKQFASNNENVTLLINSENRGPGYSRNRGIKEAKGNYITFLDSDDSFNYNVLSLIINQLNHDYDAIVFDYNKIINSKSYYETIFFCPVKEGLVNTGLALAFIKGSPWGKIYKRSIIVSNNVQFPPKYNTEDLPFTKIAISKCKSILYLSLPGYNYCITPSSLSQSNKLDVNNEIDSMKLIEEGLRIQYEKEFQIISLIHFIYYVGTNSVDSLSRIEWNNLLNYYDESISDFQKNEYYEMLGLKHRLFSKLVLNRNYNFIKIIRKIISLIR